jgi:ABC-type polysaccharide/polyol phosphate transport system ATPase subunit
MPIRYYSSGMVIRLAFAIATAMDPEILLIDEVLSAGDLSFQQKARQRMNEMMAKARIIVAASHDLDSLTQLCNQATWLDHGRLRMTGATGDIVAAYRKSMQERLVSNADSPTPSLSPAA